ncbi:SurA N-terminal domain-containing protein [Albirhodobacter sp. R86504]|uniref:peptidylprolyl isomerase n=1 Tax=Albirhodobacter sp. R86504 TaxID=3093848 RepID=UPI003672017D
MSSSLRSHGKKTVFWILMGMLILGLGGFGVTNFGGSLRSIGSVGETEVSVDQFASSLQGEVRALSERMGQPLSMAQAREFGVDRLVQARLFAAAAVDEQARIMGVSVGDGDVRDQILATPSFQDPTGKFDRETYKLALRQQGLTEAEYEAQIRAESARAIVQAAAIGGAPAPKAIIDRYIAYIGEARGVTTARITAADLTDALPEPQEADLQAYYEAHPEDFTSLETRKITYAYVTPEMIVDTIELDEAALREVYEARSAEFQQPERRLVEQLVYPDADSAVAAKAAYDAGEKTFAELAADRGLALTDADLGEVTKEELGGAGEAVFALEEPEVVGPIDTDLGPALFSMNAILEARNVTFEEAQEELAGEARMDRARRVILDNSLIYEDELAGGVTLEEIADQTDLVLGTIDYTAETQDDIAAYQAFREVADEVTASDFPELKELEDGGVFALRLDAIEEPSLLPLEDVREDVIAAWRANALQEALLAQAQVGIAALEGGASFADAGFGDTKDYQLTRGIFIEDLPDTAITAAYSLSGEGKASAVADGTNVVIVQLNAIIPADQNDTVGEQLTTSVKDQLSQGLGQDLFEYYARAAQAEAGVKLDSAAAEAVMTQLQ